MKIKCEHFKGEDITFTCSTCRQYHKCNLTQPTNETHQKIQNELDYWLNELNKVKIRINEYAVIFEDIKNNKYSIPVNVYGNIQYAPKQNVYGVFIKKPEHVMYGWNINNLERLKREILDTIRELSYEEYRMRDEL